MRERVRDIERLYHIEASISHVMEFLEGKTFEEMQGDKMCFHAVVYNIMIIGEAANMLTKEFRDEHPETPWRNIIDMRNVLVHGYYVASPLFIWETYTKDLGPLLEQVKRYIEKMQK
jgi:uncharacterized protein with HEPN domain